MEVLGREGCRRAGGTSSHDSLASPCTQAGVCPQRAGLCERAQTKQSGTLALIETNSMVPKQGRCKPYKNKGWSQDQCL